MIKQTLFFSTPVCLSLKNCQIVISWKDCDDKITRSIEDIGCVVLENQMISITLPLLNELVKNNVAVILCDNKMSYNFLFILKSATYRVSWEFTCKTTKILLLYIFLGHNRNVVNTKFPYPIKRLEVIRRFNQKSIAFNQSLS